jgi:ATP-dependent helicase/nuclease subunit A
MRNTTSLDTLLDALREAGVPYLVERDREFYRRREVFDAVSLLRAAADRLDQLALVGWMRSPVVGVPDAALAALWCTDFPAIVCELASPEPAQLRALDGAIDRARDALPRDIPGLDRVPGWDTALKDGIRALADLRRSFLEDDAVHFLDRARRWFLPEVIEAARYLGAYRFANLERLWRRFLAALTEDGAGPDTVFRELRRALEESREEEEARPGDTALDAVRVLTIHSAKGLTFRHVYVLGMHGVGGRSAIRSPHEAVPVAGGFALRLFRVPALGFDEVEERRERIAAAEAVRLLYVAATRPSERLVLAGSWDDPQTQARPVALARSLVDLLRHRKGGTPDLAAFFARSSDQEPWLRDSEGVLWRMLGTAPAFPRHFAAPAAADLEPAQVRAAMASLAGARTCAAKHEERALVSAVTALEHLSSDFVRVFGEDSLEEGPAPPRGSLTRDGESRFVGSAVHRVLEHLDLDLDPSQAMDLQYARLGRYLEEELPLPDAERLVPAVREILVRMSKSGLLARLFGLRKHIIARELPLLFNPDLPLGPAGALTGAIDLLYRDPATGRFVVADYKTDRVEGKDEIDRQLDRHLAQGRLYVEAVQRALGLPALPEFEIWFLSAGIVKRVPFTEGS